MDLMDYLRRFKRHFDTSYTIRRMFILAVILFGLIWIVGFRMIPSERGGSASSVEPAESCLERKLVKMADEVSNMDTNIVHVPPLAQEKSYMPYVGNGYVGAALYEEATVHIMSHHGRSLSLSIPFRPLVRISLSDEESRREAIISQYFRGTVRRISCIERGQTDSVEVVNTFYAHRTYPSVLEQDVLIRNPSPMAFTAQFDQLGWSGDPPFQSVTKKVQQGDGEVAYVIGCGTVENGSSGFMAVCLAYRKVPNAVDVLARQVVSFRFITVVNYLFIAKRKDFEGVKSGLLEKSETELKKVMGMSGHNFYTLHEAAWKDLWNTGFYISPSKAENSLNGDKINATMYYVLSQVRAPLHEVGVPAAQIAEANAVLSYSEGCYGGHHTLQAPSLWSSLSTEQDILSIGNLWILTLEKLGCHKLLKAGAAGVVQGMVLSFGALKFRDFHLEFNTEPKDLHRDYHFRRIWYGNGTHVNISVSLGGDNKAVLYAALDRSDKDYYACDGGCLDSPVELGPKKKQFPVKLTDPVTSILYISSDRKHAEELHLSIHVKEVLEAPAHEHHVISMHKHGSGYGAMSTMFWVLLSVLIVLFHLFLFHLVYTEYFGSSQEKYRSRYEPLKLR